MVNHSGGLNLPSNSISGLTDLADIIIAVYCRRKATKQCSTTIYSRTSMARTPLEPWEYVLDNGSSS